MGKTKKGKSKPHKANPTGLPSIDDMEFDGDEQEPKGNPINSILEQLQSPSSDEKMCGLQSLSTHCQKEHHIEAIVKGDLVRIVSPLLVDSDVNIRHAASGALRNLSAVSIEICEKLVEQDVFSPLLLLLGQYANHEWQPVKEKLEKQLDQKADTFLQAIYIVLNLCESCECALEFFNQSQLLQSFVKYLNYDVYGMEIAVAVGQCLLVISEDNTTAWKVLVNYSADLHSLLSITTENDYQRVILRTAVAGIMANVPALLLQHLTSIIEALSKTIEINHRTVLNAITSKIPLDGTTEREAARIEVIDEEMSEETEADAALRRLNDELPSDLEQEIKHIGYLLSAQRISAEVLSNIVCSHEEEEMEDEPDDKSDAESVQDYDIAQNGNGVQRIVGDKVPVEIVEIIKSQQLVEKLWQRAQLLPDNVQQILADAEKNLFKRQKSLRVSSLLCLHNFCNCLTTEELGGPKAIYNVWLDLGQQVFQTSQDFETIEASTSLMRATLEHLKGSRELFEQISENDLQLILKGVEECEHSEIKANWLRMLGTLGCLLDEKMVKKITEFILDASSNEADVWTLSESLDSFMDMFSDNDWNQIVYDLKVVAKSRELEKVLKTKMRQQKRELGSRYAAIATVRTNLARFCKYLDAQQKSFTPIKN